MRDSEITKFVQAPEFPCVAAKSALNAGTLREIECHDIRSENCDVNILEALHSFPHDQGNSRKFASLAVLFPTTPPLSEEAFEKALWNRLSALHQLDAAEFGWDPKLSDDPVSPKFGMSYGRRGFFIIGMHPNASRAARRMSCATLIFNPHSQFESLRRIGLFDQIKQSVRDRDLKLQNSLNPMLADHGESSEAAQYSGRRVPANWMCPFKRSQS